MSVYLNMRISQKKLKEKLLDIKNWEYLNIVTWEYLDIMWTENTNPYIRLTYKFSMINKSIDNKKLCKLLWPTYYGYLLLLINYIHTDWSIDYGILELKESWLNKFKWILKNNWMVKYGKFWNMKNWKYFLNPYISAYSRDVDIWLVRLFEETNETIYWINLLTK
jgi:hypothetical protein